MAWGFSCRDETPGEAVLSVQACGRDLWEGTVRGGVLASVPFMSVSVHQPLVMDRPMYSVRCYVGSSVMRPAHLYSHKGSRTKRS